MSVSSSRIPGSDSDTTDSAGIRGGTDGTIIGNVADRMKVDAIMNSSGDLATFITALREVASANNKSLFSLVNAGGSSVKIKIRSIYLINTQNSAVTGVVANIHLYRCTGHSGGTLDTPQAADTADTLNASVTARTGATIAGEGANHLLRYEISTDEWGVGASDSESDAHTVQTLLPWYKHEPPTKPITLNAGEGITIKCTTNTTTGLFDILVIYTQE